MNKHDIIIRRERPADYRTVENLVRESFWNLYRPGCMEHYVLKCLRQSERFIPELAFVLEKNGEIIGQNVFVQAEIKCDDGSLLPITTMGPICIAPAYQRQGYGKILLDYTLQKAAAYGCKALCFEGNIDFYGKSGFVMAAAKNIRYHGLPEGADSSFFLCKELVPGYLADISGEYATPRCYFVAYEKREDFELYDASFPVKQKMVLPGQIFKE